MVFRFSCFFLFFNLDKNKFCWKKEILIDVIEIFVNKSKYYDIIF